MHQEGVFFVYHNMHLHCISPCNLGTNVLRDFVELPSQLYEHWLSEPAVLNRHARHYQTGTLLLLLLLYCLRFGVALLGS